MRVSGTAANRKLLAAVKRTRNLRRSFRSIAPTTLLHNFPQTRQKWYETNDIAIFECCNGANVMMTVVRQGQGFPALGQEQGRVEEATR
jgi:hypothetical protein